MNRDRVAAVALVVAGTALKLALAARAGLLADEAYFWLWSRRLDLGYYDQPPMIAWMIRLGTSIFGDTELGVRAPAVLCTLAIVPLLWRVEAPIRLALLWLALPATGWLTGFATPDAPLLACWAIGLYGASIGGNGWWLAGVAAGLAFESKHTGAALLPLAILSAGRRDWDARTAGAVAVAALLAAPNLWWNAQHDWVTVRFQLREGLLADAHPGILGFAGWILGQVVASAGLLLVGLAWAGGRIVRWIRDREATGRASLDADRASRLAIGTSVPLLLGFGLASALAPAEAYWPDIAWIGLAMGLSGAVGPRIGRAADLAAALAVLLDGIVLLHARSPLWPLPEDPAARLTEGPILADFVASWARPPAGDAATAPVLTQRYQEAALVRFYAGIPARRWLACGRDDQFTIWDDREKPASGYFLRPWDASGTTCVDADWPGRSPERPFRGWDLAGRHAGDWELFELVPE